ncbi:HNH endonuclease [Bacillus thuringiensis]|uniref:HNH endonuclease n=1 Tax=Bacillus thuringiensis TaxID=1428 RepID=UPI0021D65DA3|nr:HNH endonuclease [Bacillus thuringiensis]MCU7675643.1 HNH endonuclease [Bacillus thuringiensis]
MVQSPRENKILKNALDAMKNTPIPVAVRMVDTGIGVRLPYIESSTVGEVAGKFSKASTAAKDDAYQLAKGSGGSGVSKEGSVAKETGKPSKVEFDKEVDKVMEEAGRNQPAYNRKPIQPKNYKKMEVNEDGTTTYTIASKSNGKEYKVTYDKNGHPIFNTHFDTTLPESKYLSGDSEQFTFCNKDLFEKAMKDSELKSKFTEVELELFKAGKKPSYYTWHHHQDKGKMQLVDYFEHEVARHTGGRAYWGGGRDGRNGKIKRIIINRIRELFSWKE